VDLTGIFRVTQAAVPLLDKAVEQGGSARVINIASVAGVLPLQLQAAYSAAKSGVISLTQSMALELGKQGILCNAIAPGTIATEGTARLWGEVTVDEAGNATHDTQTERGASGNHALLVRAADSEGGKADDSTPRSPTFVSRADAQLHMSMIALGRPGTPNDIAQGVLFLCASNYTNGHCLVIDGAWSICIRPF
jgi:NAD(P)-dependent dehydrogenase (short-subunit alcohol dehydrogenase family)